MAQENWLKYKLLKLLELLRQETDEQNPLSTSQICNKLGDMGISCERRTLTKISLFSMSLVTRSCGTGSVKKKGTIFDGFRYN